MFTLFPYFEVFSTLTIIFYCIVPVNKALHTFTHLWEKQEIMFTSKCTVQKCSAYRYILTSLNFWIEIIKISITEISFSFSPYSETLGVSKLPKCKLFSWHKWYPYLSLTSVLYKKNPLQSTLDYVLLTFQITAIHLHSPDCN